MCLDISKLNIPSEIAAELLRLRDTYEFEKLADKGQNGYLLFARNKILDRRVAIKFYYWADGSHAHVEPKSLASIKSRNVIDIQEAALVGSEWALFITPFCTNGDLDTYMQSNTLGLKKALDFGAQLLEGLASLHKGSYVHRDLKPENLLVSDDYALLIADFGSVKLIPQGQCEVTGSGHAVLYRPPESFDRGKYDCRGDTYQCGLVLYQLLGGHLPYNCLDYLTPAERLQYATLQDGFDRYKLVESAICRKAKSGTLIRIDSLPYVVPKNIRTLLKRATNPDPSKRFATASDFMSNLNKARINAIDWQNEDGQWVAINGTGKIRIVGSQPTFCVEQDNGKGWRKVPKTELGSLESQLKLVEERIAR